MPETTHAPTLRLILCRTNGPINLGMIARTCGNWGIDDLWLVDPECAIDCDDTRKFANRAIDWLRTRPVVPSINEALVDVDLAIATSARPRAGQPPLLPGEVSTWLGEQPPARRVALVFGNEQHGLNDAEHFACQTTMRLPMPGDYQSFNLAQAVATALALWPGHEQHLTASEEHTQHTPISDAKHADPSAMHQQRQELVQAWAQTADAVGHLTGVDAGKRDGWQRKIDQWLLHAPMTRDEANAMRAFLATILKKQP